MDNYQELLHDARSTKLENNLCVKLGNYQESLHDARSTKLEKNLWVKLDIYQESLHDVLSTKLEKNLCVKLDSYQESLHDARSTKRETEMRFLRAYLREENRIGYLTVCAIHYARLGDSVDALPWAENYDTGYHLFIYFIFSLHKTSFPAGETSVI